MIVIKFLRIELDQATCRTAHFLLLLSHCDSLNSFKSYEAT